MRWVLGLLPFAAAASCGGVIAASSDAGNDVFTTTSCSKDSDCGSGYVCEYPVSGGCSASKQCFPNVQCKGAFACACDGTTISACGGGAPKPIAHSGACFDAHVDPVCAVACETCDVSGYSPTPQAKPIAKAKICPASDMLAFVLACLGPNATQTTCQAWQSAENTANASCLSCILTLTTASSWGPLVCDSMGCTLNAGGCVDIVLGEIAQEQSSGGAGSCGDLVSAEDGCIDQACAGCGQSDLQACTNDAMTTSCKSYSDATASAPACSALDAGASTCFPQTTDDLASFTALFCGSP